MEEDNFFGKTTPQEPSPERLTANFMNNPATGVKIMDWEVGASGYAAVWATENTREALWDAMQRRETYATTGPRMVVRLFGGFDFEPRDAQNRMPARVGYAKGVPMGGDLDTAPAGKAPTFLVAALKDPIGANLDRYQIVKGWMDAKGALHEKVYDVAWSGNRKPGADGKVPVGGLDGRCRHTRPGRTASARRSSSRSGRIRSSIPPSAPSTMAVCSRSRRRAGPPTTRRVSATRSCRVLA